MRPRIVIADDHVFVLESLQALFQTSEFDLVASASDGRRAVELVEEHRPDIVLLDIGMSGGDGVEALEQLRAMHPSMPVVMFSFHDDTYHRQLCKALGAADFLQKGIPVKHLLERLRLALQTQTAGGE